MSLFSDFLSKPGRIPIGGREGITLWSIRRTPPLAASLPGTDMSIAATHRNCSGEPQPRHATGLLFAVESCSQAPINVFFSSVHIMTNKVCIIEVCMQSSDNGRWKRGGGGGVPRSEKVRRGRPPDSRIVTQILCLFPFWGRMATLPNLPRHRTDVGSSPHTLKSMATSLVPTQNRIRKIRSTSGWSLASHQTSK